MAPQKSTNKNDIHPYSWCLGKQGDEISKADLYSTYRINYTPCISCRRTCRKNPYCLWGFGEKKWIKNNEESHSDEEDEQLNRNEGQLAGIVNLGATCYVNSLLQLWFHNPILRPAILKWKPNNIGEPKPEDETQEGTSYKPTCPISHLQAMFARMLLSKRSTIDPTQFTTSLSLNTGEQQDAQEFSNLLMTLLDVLLEKQQSKEIQNLIKDSFTGTYAYETICETCKHTSVRSCDFRELELMVKKNLKDSIVEFLKIEILANANQYNCGMCGQPRDAQRRIKILKLPPVLNLQLMRFIYDRESQQKKKNKLQITFPEILNMADYVENGNSEMNDAESNIYILNAVLNHKGRTAHHGHYIAHIKDMNTGNWFECNDDTVQPIKSSSKTLIIKNDEANNNATTGDENKTKAKEYTSDGAYMLVYTRKSYMTNTSKVVEIHDYLKKLVFEEDKVFEVEYLKNKVAKDNEVKRKEQRQDEIALLYRDLLPKTAIETVKNENQPPEGSNSNSMDVPALATNGDLKLNSNPQPLNQSTREGEFRSDFISSTLLPLFFDLKIDPKIENKSISCIHGKLKPPGPNDTTVPYRIIPAHFSDIIFERYEYDLRLSGDSALCVECVNVNCKMVNDLASLEEDSKNFIEMSKDTDSADRNECVWISNDLVRTWKRQAKSEIESGGNREITEVDDNGDESLRNSDLQCDHGELSPSVGKTLITFAAWTIIYRYFPTAVEWSHSTPACRECLRISESNTAAQEQNKVFATNQKIVLNSLYLNRNRPTPKESRGDYFLIPTNFVNEWRRFIREPTKTSVPMIGTETLMCKHSLLMYPIHMLLDLTDNGVLDESLISLVTEFEWNYLKTELGAGTEFRIRIDDQNKIFYTDAEPCSECSVDWWTTEIQKVYVYQSGNIFIDKRDNLFEFFQEGQLNSPDCDEENIQTNGKREKKEPIRRSKRTRMTKNIKKYTNIDSSTLVKDFQKTHLFNDYAAILSDQHLYLNGKELSEKDKARSFKDLEIKSNSTLVLVVDPPTTAQSDSKDDMEVDTNEPVQQENGFRGTILQGGA